MCLYLLFELSVRRKNWKNGKWRKWASRGYTLLLSKGENPGIIYLSRKEILWINIAFHDIELLRNEEITIIKLKNKNIISMSWGSAVPTEKHITEIEALLNTWVGRLFLKKLAFSPQQLPYLALKKNRLAQAFWKYIWRHIYKYSNLPNNLIRHILPLLSKWAACIFLVKIFHLQKESEKKPDSIQQNAFKAALKCTLSRREPTDMLVKFCNLKF